MMKWLSIHGWFCSVRTEKRGCRRKRFSLFVIAALLVINTATGYTQPKPTSTTPTTEAKEFLISGALSGGAAYSVTIAMGELLNKYVTVPYRLKVVVQPITAMVESPKRLARGDSLNFPSERVWRLFIQSLTASFSGDRGGAGGGARYRWHL